VSETHIQITNHVMSLLQVTCKHAQIKYKVPHTN